MTASEFAASFVLHATVTDVGDNCTSRGFIMMGGLLSLIGVGVAVAVGDGVGVIVGDGLGVGVGVAAICVGPSPTDVKEPRTTALLPHSSRTVAV